MQPLEFLAQECGNVSLALAETLRYDFGHGGADDFYDECRIRLGSIQNYIKTVAPSDVDALQILAYELSRLSRLIALIERSHVGEFSWPFANALRRLAVAVTTDLVPSSTPLADPGFFMSAEGGLTAYRMYPEQEPVTFLKIKRKIFTINFPRTLKDHVLLHTILGHEIGHAAWTSPSTQSALKTSVLKPLVRTGPMQSVPSLRRWLRRSYGEATSEKTAANIRDSWLEEIFCDLFGALTFGPCFFPAHKTLLCAIDPTGIEPGAEHPPNASRFDTVRKAFRYLGWADLSGFGSSVTRQCWMSFRQELSTLPHDIPRFAVLFSRKQVEDAVDGLVGVLTQLHSSNYERINKQGLADIVDKLHRWMPPVAAKVTNASIALECHDFRDILLGGWMVWYGRDRLWSKKDQLSFSTINKLCDKAILQQEGVAIWKAQGADF